MTLEPRATRKLTTIPVIALLALAGASGCSERSRVPAGGSATVSGVLLESNGSPAAGSGLELFSVGVADVLTLFLSSLAPMRTVQTAEDGSFSFALASPEVTRGQRPGHSALFTLTSSRLVTDPSRVEARFRVVEPDVLMPELRRFDDAGRAQLSGSTVQFDWINLATQRGLTGVRYRVLVFDPKTLQHVVLTEPSAATSLSLDALLLQDFALQWNVTAIYDVVSGGNSFEIRLTGENRPIASPGWIPLTRGRPVIDDNGTAFGGLTDGSLARVRDLESAQPSALELDLGVPTLISAVVFHGARVELTSGQSALITVETEDGEGTGFVERSVVESRDGFSVIRLAQPVPASRVRVGVRGGTFVSLAELSVF